MTHLTPYKVSDSTMDDPLSFTSISEICVPFDPGGTVSSSISDMLVTDECLVVVSPVSSNKTLQITNSIVQHSIETTMDYNKHFPPICFLDESLAMKATFSNGLLDVERNCVGLPSGTTQPFLSSFLRGYEPFPLVKFKVLQDTSDLFLSDANENGDCIAALHAARTFDLCERLASVPFLGAGSVSSSLLSRLKGMLDSIVPSTSMGCILLVCNWHTVSSTPTLIFGTGAYELDGSQGSLLLSPTLMSKVDSKSIQTGSNTRGAKSPAPSFAVVMDCVVPSICVLVHSTSLSRKSYEYISSLVRRLFTSVAVTILPHDRGPSQVRIGSHCFNGLQDYGNCRVVKFLACVLANMSAAADAIDSSPFQVDSSSDIGSNSVMLLLNQTDSCATLLILSGMLVKTMISIFVDPSISTCSTSVDVSVLPHDRGPNLVLLGIFCICQGLYCLLGDPYDRDDMSLYADSHSSIFKVDASVESHFLLSTIANDFGRQEYSPEFCTTTQDNSRFLDYRIPPDKSTGTISLSIQFFKSICNLYYQVTRYVANKGSLQVFLMVESLFYVTFKVSLKFRAFYTSTTLNTCTI